MGGEQESGAPLLHLRDATVAFGLEASVADRDHLVDQQRIGLELRDDAEREAELHALAVRAHRGLGKRLELGELERRRDESASMGAAQAGDDRRRERVLAPGEG